MKSDEVMWRPGQSLAHQGDDVVDRRVAVVDKAEHIGDIANAERRPVHDAVSAVALRDQE